MEETVIKRGASTGALFVKLGMPLFLLMLLLLPLFAVIMALSSNSGEDVNSGDPSQLAKNEIPAKYMPIYQAAEKKYSVPWNLLAAHHKVETNFGEGNVESYAGALGAMQFMPCSWIGWGYPSCGGLGDLDVSWSTLSDLSTIKEYGGFGVDGDGDGKADPRNPTDAIFAAASYLAANGADEGMIEEAVFAYNHSNEYVSDVLEYSDLYVESGNVVEPTTGEFLWPVPFTKNITSDFGYRTHPKTGEKESFHNGIDIAAGGVMGKPTISVLPGKVIEAGAKGSYGNVVVVEHPNGLETLYGHLSAIRVSVGQKVKPGQTVGLIGSTGRSTGPHLHFKVSLNGKNVDPMGYLQ